MSRYVLGDDQPKDDPWQDDRLGYAGFAERIFRVVVGHEAPNGYVIGLHGEWGSGKSTILNFFKAFLRTHNRENPTSRVDLIEFQPWIVSGHQDLIVAFFKLLSEALGPTEKSWLRAVRRMARFGYGATDKLVDAVATVALTVDPTGGAASGIVGGVAKKSINGLLERFIAEKSLQQAYEQLRAQLKESGRHFVVTIDDIDRLQEEEVRAIMQMVKTVGRLPNVVYLLAYDRSIVGQILDRAVGEGAPRFAEKIVQQEIALPPASRHSLLKILDGEIEFLISKAQAGERWQVLTSASVQRWIKRPRDVLRLANAIRWIWPALEGNFDPADLLAMESIRLFEPVAFQWIQANTDFLFNEGDYVIGADEQRKANIQALKERLPAGSAENVITLLAVLFPHQASWFDAGGYHHESYVEAQNRRGMASRAHYDSYFAVQLSDEAIPVNIMDQILSSSDSTLVETLIRPYVNRRSDAGKELTGIFLMDLNQRLSAQGAPEPNQALLQALFAVGEAISDLPWTGGFTASPDAALRLVVRDILKAWGPGVADERLLQIAAERSAPIGVTAVVYLYILSSKAPDGEKRGLHFLEDDTSVRLGNVLLPRIRAASTDGDLRSNVLVGDILRAWKELAGVEEPRQWLSSMLAEDPQVTVRWARQCMRESIDSGGRHYEFHPERQQDLFDVRQLMDASEKLLKTTGDLTDDDRAVLAEVLRTGPTWLEEGERGLGKD